MNIETVSGKEVEPDFKRSHCGQFLPPTVLAVKQLAHSKLLLSSGVVLFLALLVLSVCDFRVGVILLPLGIFILTAHIVAFAKSKHGNGGYGLGMLSVAYLIPIFIQCAFSIWKEIFYYAGKPAFFGTLGETTLDLPMPFDTIVNQCDFNTELIFSILSVVFLSVSFVLISLITAKHNNTPSLAMPIIGFICVLAVSAVPIGWKLFDIISGFLSEFAEPTYDALVLRFMSLGTALLLIAYSVTVCVYTVKIFVIMKRIKNAVQK